MKNKLSDLSYNQNTLNGFYRGIVEDRNDPQKLGRCKIRVFGVHTDIKEDLLTEGVPTKHLPWAEPITSLIEGGVSGFGVWSVPLQGSQVLVFFEEGNIMHPRYIGSLPGRPEESSKGKGKVGFNDPQEKYPIDKKNVPHEPVEKNENDIHKLATGDKINDTIVKSKNDQKITGVSTSTGMVWSEPNSFYNTNYPDNIVLSTHSGITIELDNTNGEERVHIYHPSNSYIEIGPDGDIVIRNTKDSFELVDVNKKIHIGGDYDKTVDGNKTNYIKQNQTELIDKNLNETIVQNKTKIVQQNQTTTININKSENVGSNKTINIGGNESKSVGGQSDCVSGGVHNINASIINLNC